MITIIIGVVLKVLLIHGLYSDNRDGSDGMPAILWVAMGTNIQEDENGFLAGWYDSSNRNIFLDNDSDAEKSSAVGRIILKNFLVESRQNPKCFLRFMNNKITTQWEAGMLQSLQVQYSSVNPNNKLAETIWFDADAWYKMETYMKYYHFLVLAMVLLYIIEELRQPIKHVKTGLEQYVGLITVFGGFIFSMIWEAKTRYIFPYFVMMIPYAVMGMDRLFRKNE